MASLSRDAGGLYRIQFVGHDRKRRAIRLGSVNKKTAEEVRLKVEHLNALQVTRLPMDTEIAAWVVRIGDDLAEKLSIVGLIPPRESRTLAGFLETYIEGRKADSKPATIITLQQVQKDLITLYGPKANLRDIGPEQADNLRTHYQSKGLALATTYRRLKMARMFFARAKTFKLIAENPFAEVKSKNSTASERQHYITPADTEALLEQANPTWRTVIALARFAGLRCPSEVLSLRWENVDLAAGRMTVTSPKTSHLEGRAYRVVPVFAALRPHLQDAFDLAEPGEVYVVGGATGATFRKAAQGAGGWANSNLRTTFEKIIRRAGLTPWPRLFHNLRASLETDLMATHSIHVVTAWVGNTPKIALSHYLQTLDADFAKAIGGAESGAQLAQKAAQTASASPGLEKTNATETLVSEPFRRVVSDSVRYCPDVHVAEEGLEPTRLLGG
ncbi:hypothetical protein BH11PLA2_BH11PLA2_40240 [soil metagenome]